MGFWKNQKELFDKSFGVGKFIWLCVDITILIGLLIAIQVIGFSWTFQVIALLWMLLGILVYYTFSK